MYSVKKLESNGKFGPHEAIGGAHFLSNWSFINITTIDGVEIQIKKDGNNPPTTIILNQGYLILEYN